MVGSVPNEVMESARIDGCSEFKIFSKFALPLSRPALGAFAIYQFVFSWNSFLWPLIVLNETGKYTLPVGLQSLFGIFYLKEFGVLMAGSALAIIPVVILFVLMQEHFVSGLTVGAVKEWRVIPDFLTEKSALKLAFSTLIVAAKNFLDNLRKSLDITDGLSEKELLKEKRWWEGCPLLQEKKDLTLCFTNKL